MEEEKGTEKEHKMEMNAEEAEKEVGVSVGREGGHDGLGNSGSQSKSNTRRWKGRRWRKGRRCWRSKKRT